MKLGVIVPYRNRESHLSKFTDETTAYLKSKKIDFEIVVVEQSDDKPFNRGKLLNIGYLKAKELGCDYVVFHDVDMIPIEVDYSFSEIPLHLATNFELEYEKSKNLQFDDYFGGVTMLSNSIFEKINGYSNLYWGWGFEDDDLLFRVNEKKIPIDTKIIGKNQFKKIYGLTFGSDDSYIKIAKKDLLDFEKDTSILISFKPDDIISNPNKDYDEYTVFSIPGYDTSISFNSFSRYNFCTFSEEEKNVFYANSNIKPNYKTNICVRFNVTEKIISVFQDGELIEDINHFEKLIKYNKESFFYLGVGDPNREHDLKYFKGHMDSFAVFNDILEDEEIKEISKNRYFGLTQNFGNYISSHTLQTYYDAKFIKDYKLIDLSGNGNDGEIINCEITELEFEPYKEVKIPFRRESKFGSLFHKENGFFNNKWKHKATRWNQLRFQNEVLLDDKLIKNDGLSTLEFIEHGRTHENNITHINIGI